MRAIGRLGRGGRGGGGGPSSRRALPAAAVGAAVSPLFCTLAIKEVPEAPTFPAPLRRQAEKLFFTLLVFNYRGSGFCWARAAVRARGPGDGRSQKARPGPPGWGLPGRWAGKAPRSGRPGGAGGGCGMPGAGRPWPGMGSRGRAGREGRGGQREWRGRATGRASPLFLWAQPSRSWPQIGGRWGTRGKGTVGGKYCTPAGGRILARGPMRTETHRTLQ